MKIRTRLTTFSFMILFLLSCNSSQLREREIALKEKELELARKELELAKKELQSPVDSTTRSAPVHSQSVVKYMYIVIKTDEPIIGYKLGERIDGILSGSTDDPPVRAIPKYFSYTSDIIQVDDYSEDKRYMEIDKFERTLRPHLNEVNRKIEERNFRSERPVKAEAKVISKKSFVFDTYAEASRHRSKGKYEGS